MRVYNTITRTKEEFVPRQAGKVAMYVCGPTVYNYIHIGNARTFLSFDVIRRYLAYRGFDVTFVQNVTDVDDKIIARAAEENTTAAEIAAKYTEAFISCMHELNILDPDIRPKATEEIDSMIALVEDLISGGHAYEKDGSVYFSVRSFPGYGKLSGRDIEEMRGGERDLRGGNFDDQKADALDFALWKAAKPGEPAWDSPWGKGRPGWHIECSAMSSKYLGLPLDIHGGGNDLVFPHHENEIAQSEASSGEIFSNYWLHGGMLLVDSEKMSKSEGNFLFATNVVAENDPSVVRLLMLQTHYRSPLDYSTERLAEAKTSYDRIATAVRNLEWAAKQDGGSLQPTSDAPALLAACESAHEGFIEAMDDDFNTAGALGVLFHLVGEANSFMARVEGNVSEADACAMTKAAATIKELLDVLGVRLPEADGADWPQEVIALAKQFADYEGNDRQAAVDALLAARSAARAAKNWAVSDAVRDGLGALGFTIEDTPDGARVSFTA